VYGERDVACIQTSKFMAATIPGACLWMVPDAGHLINLEYEQLFNETVLTFLRQCIAGPEVPTSEPGVQTQAESSDAM
jgi:pimeloyl-ACP methyl ester carboxylesterase